MIFEYIYLSYISALGKAKLARLYNRYGGSHKKVVKLNQKLTKRLNRLQKLHEKLFVE